MYSRSCSLEKLFQNIVVFKDIHLIRKRKKIHNCMSKHDCKVEVWVVVPG